MKKITSHQIPRAQIVRPLLLGGLALAATAGIVEAQGCVAGAANAAKKSTSSGSSSGSDVGKRYQQYNTPSSKAQQAISKSPGCVLGAVPYSGGSSSKSKSTPKNKSKTQ